MAQGIGNVVNPKTTRRDMQSGMIDWLLLAEPTHMDCRQHHVEPSLSATRIAEHGQELGTGNGRLRQR